MRLGDAGILLRAEQPLPQRDRRRAISGHILVPGGPQFTGRSIRSAARCEIKIVDRVRRLAQVRAIGSHSRKHLSIGFAICHVRPSTKPYWFAATFHSWIPTDQRSCNWNSSRKSVALIGCANVTSHGLSSAIGYLAAPETSTGFHSPLAPSRYASRHDFGRRHSPLPVSS